jgi:hypothetical protein
MRRRRLLAASSAALLGGAGCLGTPGDDSAGSRGPDGTAGTAAGGGDTSTEAPDQTPTDAAVSVSLSRLQPGILLERSDDVVVEGGGREFLFLTVDVEADALPDPEDLRFRFGGTDYRPVDPDDEIRGHHLSDTEDAPPYDPESGSGWLLYDLPETGDASDAGLVWDGGRWWPEGLSRDRLAAVPPTLSLAWTVPEEVSYSTDESADDPTVRHSFSVTNEGDHDGRFVAGLNRTGYVNGAVGVVERRIPAGETVTWEYTDALSYVREFGEGEVARYTLEWVEGSPSREVRPVAESDG